MKTSHRVPARLSSALLVLALGACGGPQESPENRIKQLVADGEKAAQARDISTLGELVADGYQDERGYDRRTVLRIVQGLFLRNQDIHLLTVVRDLQVEGAEASAVVLVAMAGRPIESAQSLVNLNADLVRFDVDFVREDGDWRVHAADWRRAEVKDFL